MTMFSRNTFLLALFVVCAQALALSTQPATSRRSFLSKAPLVAGAFGAGMLLRHDGDCSCRQCAFGPEPAVAYERRDVGGDDRSPEQAAFNEQAFKTNNRLEKDGFKFETKEEEAATLSAAMSSFSYPEESKKSSKKSAKDKNKSTTASK
jgi:hypothetical protein